ncbi:MAG: hypothetical protein K6F09_08335 [Clostridiales bacterium]|nr:hypothetical protein [Clostridiales bacterium]
MKYFTERAIPVLLLFSAIFLLFSCTADKKEDIYIFAENFNDISSVFKIKHSDIALISDGDTKEYEIFLDDGEDKFLLSVYSDRSGTVSGADVTFDKDKRTDESKAEKFISTVYDASKALAKEYGEDVGSVLKKGDIKKAITSSDPVTLFKKGRMFECSLSSDTIGAAFSIRTTDVTQSETETPTLRKREHSKADLKTP